MNDSTTSQGRATAATASPRPRRHERIDEPLRPVNDFYRYVKHYARQKPGVVALTCLGIGFVLGWKLKPW